MSGPGAGCFQGARVKMLPRPLRSLTRSGPLCRWPVRSESQAVVHKVLPRQPGHISSQCQQEGLPLLCRQGDVHLANEYKATSAKRKRRNYTHHWTGQRNQPPTLPTKAWPTPVGRRCDGRVTVLARQRHRTSRPNSQNSMSPSQRP